MRLVMGGIILTFLMLYYLIYLCSKQTATDYVICGEIVSAIRNIVNKGIPMQYEGQQTSNFLAARFSNVKNVLAYVY